MYFSFKMSWDRVPESAFSREYSWTWTGTHCFAETPHSCLWICHWGQCYCHQAAQWDSHRKPKQKDCEDTKGTLIWKCEWVLTNPRHIFNRSLNLQTRREFHFCIFVTIKLCCIPFENMEIPGKYMLLQFSLKSQWSAFRKLFLSGLA